MRQVFPNVNSFLPHASIQPQPLPFDEYPHVHLARCSVSSAEYNPRRNIVVMKGWESHHLDVHGIGCPSPLTGQTFHPLLKSKFPCLQADNDCPWCVFE